MTRSKFLPLLLHRPDLNIQLYARFASFYVSCFQSQNSLVNISCQIPHSNSNVFRNNIYCLLNYLGISQTELDNLAVNSALKNRILSRYYMSLDPTTIAEAHVIEELIQGGNLPYTCTLKIFVLLKLITFWTLCAFIAMISILSFSLPYLCWFFIK